MFKATAPVVLQLAPGSCAINTIVCAPSSHKSTRVTCVPSMERSHAYKSRGWTYRLIQKVLGRFNVFGWWCTKWVKLGKNTDTKPFTTHLRDRGSQAACLTWSNIEILRTLLIHAFLTLFHSFHKKSVGLLNYSSHSTPRSCALLNIKGIGRSPCSHRGLWLCLRLSSHFRRYFSFLTLFAFVPSSMSVSISHFICFAFSAWFYLCLPYIPVLQSYFVCEAVCLGLSIWIRNDQNSDVWGQPGGSGTTCHYGSKAQWAVGTWYYPVVLELFLSQDLILSVILQRKKISEVSNEQRQVLCICIRVFVVSAGALHESLANNHTIHVPVSNASVSRKPSLDVTKRLSTPSCMHLCIKRPILLCMFMHDSLHVTSMPIFE